MIRRFSMMWLAIIIVLLGCGPEPTAPASDVIFVTVTPVPQIVATATAALPQAPSKTRQYLLANSWGGEFKLDQEKRWILLIADFAEETSGLRVSVTFPLDADRPPFVGPAYLETQGDLIQIRFEISSQVERDTAPFAFAGQLQDNKIVGEVTQAGRSGPFELAPLSDFAPDVLEGRT